MLHLTGLFLLVSTVFASSHRSNSVYHRRHTELAKKDGSDRFTYYDAGLGACGTTNTASDFIVAMSAQDWDNGAHCYDMITITYDGKSTTAQIVDECMGCPSGALDFSEGLFEYFASTDTGEIYGSWSYVGDSTTTSTSVYVAPTTTSTKKTTTKTSTTSTWTPTTTSTWSSTSSSTWSSSSSSSSSFSSSSSSSWSSSSVYSSSATPSFSSIPSSSAESSSSSATASSTGAIAQLNQAYAQMGLMLVAGSETESSS